MAKTAVETQAAIDAANAALMGGWDSIEIPPDFAVFPSGSYLFDVQKMSYNPKEGFIDVTLVLVGAVEVPESVLPIPVEGSLYFERYRLAYKGDGTFAKCFGHIGQHMGLPPLQFIEQAAGLQIIATIKTRKDKEDATKFYNNIVQATTEELMSAV